MLTRTNFDNTLNTIDSEVKIEHLLELIKIEIESTSASIGKTGWNNSTILVILVPVLVLFQTELQKFWESPVTVLDNWLFIFLWVSLIFDSFTISVGFGFRRFIPPDIRHKYQWTNLFDRKVNGVDLIRYGVLIAAIFYKDFQAGFLVDTIVIVAYSFVLLFELVKRALNHFTLIFPFQWFKRTEQTVYFICSFLFFASSMFYFGYFSFNFNTITAKDIYISGLICSIFYLLRLIGLNKKTDYVMSLEEVRRELCLGDLKSEEAKRRIIMIVEGMSLPETVIDLVEPALVLLNKMKSEIQLASQLLSSARDEATRSTDADALEERLANAIMLQHEQGNTYKRLSAELNRIFQSSKYKINSGLLRRYKKATLFSFSQQSVLELKDVKNELNRVIEECNNNIDSYEQILESYLHELTSKHIELNINLIDFDRNLPEAKDIFPFKESFWY